MVAQPCEYHLKIIELYTLNQQKIWHVNYISTKHFLKYPLRGGFPERPMPGWVNKIQPEQQPAFGWVSFP